MMIFTNGASLSPVKVGEHWVWMVESFEDDSYLDGEVYNPKEWADTREELIASDPDYPEIENYL